ncbi:reverse transcriptase domain-containing protein [Tanacetum coccineum]|uniref:Reverse transcriptase domain-containing protein n=1 Tax=Tanacetum coccineum TaxID=301880 RepID=A0ABQ4WU39_9ASTR
MTGVLRHIAEHRLNVREGCQPVRQKKRGQAAERNIAINDEVSKLMAAGIIREVHYHDWLSNPVMTRRSKPYVDSPAMLPDAYKRLITKYKGRGGEEKNRDHYDQGIKICPDNVDAVLSLQSPKCLKDVQKLNGKLASLNRRHLRQMKEHIVKLRMLTAPEEQEELIVYLAASKEAVSAVLMTEREAGQMLIYFVSRALRGPEVNYTYMEKLVLVLVHASKRLRRDFQAHPIIVITDQPIKNILSNLEVAGKMQKWSIQLGEFGIHYRSRVSVKGQVMADFIVERPEEEGQDDSAKEEEPLPAQWTLFTDGSSCVDGCRVGVILTDPEGVEFTYALRFLFEATNNEAEYEALIAGLRIAEKIGVQSLQVNVDSKLVANQVNGTYIAKETDMIKYLEKVKTLATFAHLTNRVIEELKEKSVNESEVLAVVEEERESWMTLGHEYLTDETLPAKRKKARAIKRMPSSQNLPKKSEEKLIRHISVPLLQWGIDIAGPFPEGPGKVKFLIVAMDYFTKWIEAKPVATITGNQVKKFVWENIVCRFGLPGEIISDNGKQFRDNPFKDWCEKLCIQQHFASVKHPQTNGLVERANRSLGEGIKARLGKDNKNWMEEISHVLWAHRTMVKSSNGDTPFSLTYGTEAVIPAEIGMPTFRTTELDMAKNDEALQINLELLEEKREQAAITEAKSKRQMEKYYNAKVRNTSFKPGDLVYRNNEASRAEDTGKLGPKWEGPYEVTEALGKGSYRLKDRNGKELPRTWNVCNLKKCYIHKM